MQKSILHLNFSLRSQANGSSFQKGLTQALCSTSGCHHSDYPLILEVSMVGFESEPASLYGQAGPSLFFFFVCLFTCVPHPEPSSLLPPHRVEHGNQFNTNSGKVGNCCGSVEDKYNSF